MEQGAVYVVSGVGPGVGQAAVRLLVERGATVVLGARNLGKLERLCEELPSAKTLALQLDVADRQSCQAFAEKAMAAFGRIDGLINNAFHFGTPGNLATASLDEEWLKPFQVNLIGTLQVVQALLPALEASKGAIVMVNTVASRMYMDGATPAYAISKSALHAATRILAAELAGSGVRVNSVVPGSIDGEPMQSFFEARGQAEGVGADAIRQRITQALPLRYIPTDEDVAKAILYLVGQDSRGITGASLDINSGSYMTN